MKIEISGEMSKHTWRAAVLSREWSRKMFMTEAAAFRCFAYTKRIKDT